MKEDFYIDGKIWMSAFLATDKEKEEEVYFPHLKKWLIPKKDKNGEIITY